ncbi:hypothetical protein LWI28_001977 [Acer negundo]|uniref:Uncharacterized protein n=1 Tax=Acer negundo TaxID=4023 RepID=A0AAD5IL35_ACENE|nr:hypothetical protein LWI28_001977 [Acer negundo]
MALIQSSSSATTGTKKKATLILILKTFHSLISLTMMTTTNFVSISRRRRLGFEEDEVSKEMVSMRFRHWSCDLPLIDTGRKWDYKEGYGFGRTYYRKEGIGRQSTRDTEERDGGRKPDVRLVDSGNTGKDILLASSSKGKEIVTTIEKGMNPDFMGFKDDLVRLDLQELIDEGVILSKKAWESLADF